MNRIVPFRKRARSNTSSSDDENIDIEEKIQQSANRNNLSAMEVKQILKVYN